MAALVSCVRPRRSPSATVVNLRSVTTKRVAEGRAVFCKTSDLCLRREAEILSEEANHRAGPVRAVPFVMYDGQRNELVTEYVSGDNLFNVLWNSTSCVTRRWQAMAIAELVRAVAAWLAAFHYRWRSYPTTAGTPAVDCRAVESAVHQKLDDLVTALPGTRRNAEFVARLRRHARSAASDRDWDRLPMSLIHGDFAAGNVLVASNGTAFVMDFADARVGFTLEDVARFWSSIWELAACGRRRRAVFEPLLQDILSVNGFPLDVRRSAPFVLMREWNSITKLLEVRSLRGRVGLGTMCVLRRIAGVHRQWLEQVSAPFERR